jgi:2-polyprenyl-3-methyl-5-hydroxy-6-metoxy-1,4-benzoquinol methylase
MTITTRASSGAAAGCPPAEDGSESNVYCRIIGEGHRNILEIGCGFGDLTYRLAGCTEKIVGIDISQKAIETARARLALWPQAQARAAAIEFRQMSAVRLDFPDETFDWAISISVVEHLHPEDVHVHLTEAWQVLKPQGTYIMWCPNGLGHHKDRDGHFSMLSYAAWISRLRQAGFQHFRSTLATRPPLVDAQLKVFLERAMFRLKIRALWSHLGIRNVLLIAGK